MISIEKDGKKEGGVGTIFLTFILFYFELRYPQLINIIFSFPQVCKFINRYILRATKSYE